MTKTMESKSMTAKPKEPKQTPISVRVKNIIKSIDNFLRTGYIKRYAWGLAKSMARLFGGAIFLVVLASFAPELREQLPSLYLFVDWLLGILEWICSMVCNFLHLC